MPRQIPVQSPFGNDKVEKQRKSWDIGPHDVADLAIVNIAFQQPDTKRGFSKAMTMQDKLERLFEELAGGPLTGPEVDLLTVQIITLNPGGNNLMRHVRGHTEEVEEAYLRASNHFTGEIDHGRPVRSLVFLEPNAFGYCKTIPPETLLDLNINERSGGDTLYSPDDEVRQADEFLEVESMERPDHLEDRGRIEISDLEAYFRKCLAIYQGDPGTLVWLHSKASPSDVASLFAVFRGDLNEHDCKDEVMRHLDNLLQMSTIDYYTGRLKKRALETSISNIFARNFAHNIGSHVAANATNKKVKDRIKELYQKTL